MNNAVRLFGVYFAVHPLFWLIVIAALLTGSFIEIITLFAIVLIHEMGHLCAARQFGWHILSVQLLPFGGLVEVDEGGNLPAKEEIWVALAGPLQNLWMIAVAFLLFEWGVWSRDWLVFFIRSNLILIAFNLLPVMPLDGGKIMQAVLSLAMPYYKAIRGSVRFSLLLAACMACFALLLLGVRVIHLNLLMVGGFLLYSNWYERLHLPYRFLRFLLARYRMPRRWNRTRKIVVKRLVPGEIVKQFYRERNHRILLLASDKPGKKEEILSEHQLLARYFRSFSP